MRKIGRLHQAIAFESGAIACEAEFVLALFDTTARKLVDPTPAWLACLGLSVEQWQAQSAASE